MDIKQILEQHIELREKLFIRGFLATTSEEVYPDGFPLYGQWNKTTLSGLNFWTHKLTGFHYIERNGVTAFLLGHCYNPFTMEISEEKCLERILDHYKQDDFYDCLDEITGIFVIGFIADGKIEYIADPSGMQSGYYGYIDDKFYLTSHPQLVADICNLEMSDACKELVAYKWYGRVMGPYLPVDMSPFEELKRIVPDISYTSSLTKNETQHYRFYPIKNLEECKNDTEYKQVIESAATIIKNNLNLIVQKWNNPGISLTGGIDSNTTFAAANGIYDKLHTFSMDFAEKSKPDCEAAEKIAKRFGVKWNYYQIPENNATFDLFDEKSEIINHNSGYAFPLKDHDKRYRLYLDENKLEPVEIKSWTSETIRGYWYKHYGRKNFPKLSGKLYRNLYKIFLSNRKLAHKLDKLFDKYIKDFEYDKIPAQYPPADIHYNEVTWGGWGGPHITDMKYYTDIVIPYNNRKFLDLLFKVSLDKRISDQHHLDMKRFLNPDLADMNIRVVNLKETDFRAFCLNCIFVMNCILP